VGAGTLFVVATPIGNLEDITFRALRVLREVAVVAAEDTRRSGQLLRHFGIQTPLTSLHAHNEGQKTERLLDRLRRGESVAVVSDAGTPAVSDPGAELVAAARAEGIRVEPVPGASAVMAAISASGLSDIELCFLGFPPTRSKDRNSWFERLSGQVRDRAVVFFEAPHRILATLRELGNLSIDRIIVFRELTKLHESHYEGTPAEVISCLSPVAGEFTVVVPRLKAPSPASSRPSDAEILHMIGQITDKGGRAAAREVAALTGLSVNEVYEVIRSAKG
jgi:16S rRNA (cytidine1402-2'-O)-methyltransferase